MRVSQPASVSCRLVGPVLLLAAFGLVTLPSLAGAISALPIGSGGGWFDCNNDGNLDICYVTVEGRVHLLIYDPTQERFVDHTDTAIPAAIQETHVGLGVACGDVNNDGWSDLFLTFQGPNRLLLNNKDNTFVPITRPAGIKPGVSGDQASASAAIFDYDNDGLLDIYVTNYEGFENQFFHNDGIDQDGIPHFTDVAPDLGMDWAPNGQSDWSLGVTVGDYDNDGDPDLYVANDYDGLDPDIGELLPGPNILYRNNGDGTFTDVTAESGAGDDGWAMGAAFGDFDGDGWLDIFVANFWVDALLRNNRDGTFTNVTAESGFPTTFNRDDTVCTVCNGWGTGFIDFDNDGDLDIHVANGFITNGEGQDANEANELWENIGVGGNGYVQFREVGVAAGIADVGDGRGAAYGDFNADGFVDILVINNNYLSGPDIITVPQRQLFVNQKDGTFREMGLSLGLRNQDNDAPPQTPRGYFADNNWLEIRPVGVNSNADGFGVRITVEDEGKIWLQDRGASTYCSSNSPYLHFGLGQRPVVDRITVRFPNGVQVIKLDEPTNRILTITENDISPVRILSLTVTAESDGARLDWRYRDDGDVSAFIVSRIESERETDLTPWVRAAEGAGTFLDRDAPVGIPVTYVLDALMRDGSRERVGSASFRYEIPAPITVLGQNHPNPFLGATSIPVFAPGGAAKISIYDTRGRLVRSLGAILSSGEGVLHWDGRDGSGRRVPAGTYFYRLEGTDHVRKMIRRP